MNKQPILSICIPTYNRSSILRNVLDHYVKNPEFDEDVELVISDNASTDDTEAICLDYSSRYSNIKYCRNDENIQDKNFIQVLNCAKGEYLKLYNDWAYCSQESLRFIKEKVKAHLEDQKPVFFTSGVIYTKYKSDIIQCNNLDDYVKVVSTYVTFNNIFGVWRSQWGEVAYKQRYSALKLQQVDWTYQIVSQNGGCVLYDKKVFFVSDVPVGIRGGYNWFQIHLDNYYKIMMPYIQRGQISRGTYRSDKRNLLYHFNQEIFFSLIFNYSQYWKFETKGTYKLIWKYYKNEYFFYVFLIFMFLFNICKWVWTIFFRILRGIKHCFVRKNINYETV